ncbi:unnamed protein product [Brugia pahangi]|uniref:Uncharacterized protein n=1 Tax=Brugia pahangi TaxID=6280 RepID=A0A3P7QNV2_BRUPA|nr:unnamed protein product [Brugia pahangi]
MTFNKNAQIAKALTIIKICEEETFTQEYVNDLCIMLLIHLALPVTIPSYDQISINVRKICCYYKIYDSRAEVMAASFRNIDEILSCDLVTIR